MCCAATANLGDATGGQEPGPAAADGEAGQAAPAAVDSPPAKDGEPGFTSSIGETAGRTKTASAAVHVGLVAQPATVVAGAAGDAAQRDVTGPAAAALAAWESVGNMLSDDEQSEADGNGDVVPRVPDVSSAGNADADGQSLDAQSGESETSGDDAAELSHRAELPGERSLEELEATLLYGKVLTANDVKGSIALPEVRPYAC